MLKHGRFLQNLVVSPQFPKPIYQSDEEDNEEDNGEDAAGDDNAEE